MSGRSGWHRSTRSKRLPPNWQTLRTHVQRAARGKCQATHHAPGCNGTGTEVDHIIPGDNHAPSNLQLLSAQCHAAKTRAENAARQREWAAMRAKPREQHPGRRGGGTPRG